MSKIAVIGSGSIGSLFGGLLAEAGNEVTLIGRYDHVTAIKKNGLYIKGLINKYITKIKAETDLHNIQNGNFDLFIVTVKAYDAAQAASQIKPLIQSTTSSLFLQNGIGIEDEILKILGGQFLRGITFCGVELSAPGKILCTGFVNTIIGTFNLYNQSKAEKILKIFKDAGIPCEFSNNIRGVVWTKTIVNAALNPYGTITEMKNGELVKNENIKELMKETIQEGEDVAEKHNICLEGDPIQLLFKTADATAGNYNSMLQDMKRKKRTEIDYMNGAISKFGKKMNVKTPLNDLLTFIIKNLENRARSSR